MRRVSTVLLVGAMFFGTPGAAYADHNGYGYDERGDEYGSSGECQSGGCRNDQRRCQGDNCTDNHKSFSPDLKDSPITICMPESTCNFDGKKDERSSR